MKFDEFKYVITLVDKDIVKKGTVGLIIHCFDNPEGYEVEFCDDSSYTPWATLAYKPNEIAIFQEKTK